MEKEEEEEERRRKKEARDENFRLFYQRLMRLSFESYLLP
jgi:hypothetical protein